jgi:hypothetical protein
MGMKVLAALLLLTTACALAQEPDQATKSWALKRAYQLNGNSMVGDKMIDLSNESPYSIVVKPEKIIPTPTPTPTREKHADAAEVWEVRRKSDICTQHHKHKVVTQGGKSWRCK